MDDLEEFYENFIDQIINEYPLTTSRLSEFEDAININQQIVNRISNIRRHFYQETQPSYLQPLQPLQSLQSFQIQEEFLDDDTNGEIATTFDDDIINTIFEYFLNSTLTTFTDLNELDDVKITLSKEQLDTFEKKKVSELKELFEFKEPLCSICMDDYKEEDKIIILKCNHYYHEKCIENWLCNQKVTCPICRKDTREML
jgi:RING-finger-containing ubiquitin ligase